MQSLEGLRKIFKKVSECVMASITIREVDGTIYGLANTSTDNIVFVPGTAITGPSEPTICNSFKEFTNIFGDKYPESEIGNTGTNWEYAANILIAGFPVMFRRITTDSTGASLVTKAVGLYNVDVSGTITPVLKVEALYGGTFGNNLRFNITRAESYLYLRLARKYIVNNVDDWRYIETIRLSLIGSTDEETRRNLAEVIRGGIKSDYITVSIVDDHDDLLPVGETDTIDLSGGTDADPVTAAISSSTVFSELDDKLIYNIKFITAGGWTSKDNENIPGEMVDIAKKRADCIALIDIPFGTIDTEVKNYFTNAVRLDTSYAAAYAPWALMELSSGTTGTTKWMPPSFVFLKTLAISIRSGNRIWFPPAGVRRATISGIVNTEYPVGTSLLESWQNIGPTYINPIMRVKQYGYVIYGQRTLYRSVDGSINNRSALQELGVRITANEIKRRIYDISLELTFEQNNIHTWNEFRGLLDPFMAQMLNDGALYGYEIIMDETTTTSSDIDENRIVGVVRANITRAAEDFEIGFELTASSVSFTEQ